MPKLSGDKRKKLRSGLLSAYPSIAKLKMMVDDELVHGFILMCQHCTLVAKSDIVWPEVMWKKRRNKLNALLKPPDKKDLDCSIYICICFQKELVEYYYYWKKTPISTVPNRTGRRQKSRNKVGGGTTTGSGLGGATGSKAASSSAGDNSCSESGEEIESNESYTCFRCDTESSNQWHYVDQHGFVCESCKLNYRKYGDENGEKIPEYLFRPVEPASNYRR